MFSERRCSRKDGVLSKTSSLRQVFRKTSVPQDDSTERQVCAAHFLVHTENWASRIGHLYCKSVCVASQVGAMFSVNLYSCECQVFLNCKTSCKVEVVA